MGVATAGGIESALSIEGYTEVVGGVVAIVDGFGVSGIAAGVTTGDSIYRWIIRNKTMQQ